MTKTIINTALLLVSIGLAYYLVKIIKDPIKFDKESAIRKEVVINRLKDVRTAQLAYKDLKGNFAGNFNTLINTLKNEDFPKVKIIGNPDAAEADTSIVVEYDTTWIPMFEHAFGEGYPKDSLDFLRWVPYSDNKVELEIAAGIITENRTVKLPVFEVSAPEEIVYAGLFKEKIDYDHKFTVGSLTKATYSGNWE